MSESSENNKRIAKNTFFLYFRMLLIMAVSLYTSRLNLQILGVNDFGIYNVVGGIVAMFSIFSSSLASSISRFITYELGSSNTERLKCVFSTAVNVQILLAVFIVIIAEVVGMWFLNNKIVLSPERLNAAHWAFHCSIATFAVNLISVPYSAAIIAHERMNVFAYIGIFEVACKLLICYLLLISSFDKLITFAILLLALSCLLRVIYGIYCKSHFKECAYSPILDKTLLKDVSIFAGWSSFTMVAYTCYTSGLNVLLNLFFGPAVNAARGIMVQVQNAVQGFCRNFQTAVNPQIIKNYANGNIDQVFYLIYKSSKFSYFLMLLFSLPIIYKTDAILGLWLVEVPEHTSNFVQLIMLIIVIDSVGGPLYTAQQATGNIKKFQLITGTLMLTILPLSYVSLKMGFVSESIFVIYAIVLAVVQVVSVFILYKSIGLPLGTYIREVVVKIIFVTIVSIFATRILLFLVPENDIISFLAFYFSCFALTAAVIYFIGLNHQERTWLSSAIKKKL